MKIRGREHILRNVGSAKFEQKFLKNKLTRLFYKMLGIIGTEILRWRLKDLVSLLKYLPKVARFQKF